MRPGPHSTRAKSLKTLINHISYLVLLLICIVLGCFLFNCRFRYIEINVLDEMYDCFILQSSVTSKIIYAFTIKIKLGFTCDAVRVVFKT